MLQAPRSGLVVLRWHELHKLECEHDVGIDGVQEGCPFNEVAHSEPTVGRQLQLAAAREHLEHDVPVDCVLLVLIGDARDDAGACLCLELLAVFASAGASDLLYMRNKHPTQVFYVVAVGAGN